MAFPSTTTSIQCFHDRTKFSAPSFFDLFEKELLTGLTQEIIQGTLFLMDDDMC